MTAKDILLNIASSCCICLIIFCAYSLMKGPNDLTPPLIVLMGFSVFGVIGLTCFLDKVLR